jgi:deoxyribonucleoside regulator
VNNLDELLLLAEIASLYYEENLTQEEIARRLGISRSGVSRLLARSRELGLVDIVVHHPLKTAHELQQELIARYNLHDALVLLNPHPQEYVLDKLGALAARYVDRQLRDDMTLGISWGTSMLQVVSSLRPTRRLRLNVVQLMGSISATSPDVDGPEIARRFATLYGAQCYYLHAPLLVASPAVRDALLSERSMQETIRMMSQMNMALVGVGATSAGGSGLVRAGYLNEQELAAVRALGAVGDVSGYFLDQAGNICPLELHDRLVAVPLELLRRTPEVIAVAAGLVKAAPMLAAVRSGLVHTVITDETCAKEMLALDTRVETAPKGLRS